MYVCLYLYIYIKVTFHSRHNNNNVIDYKTFPGLHDQIEKIFKFESLKLFLI